MMRFSRAKFNIAVMLLFMCIVNMCLSLYYVNGSRDYTSQDIFAISWIAITELVILTALWKKMSSDLLSPFIIVTVAAVMFGMGQIFGWAFKLDMGELDLQKYIPAIGMHYVGDSLIYTLNGLILFIFGGACVYPDVKNNKINYEDTVNNEIDKSAIRIVSTFLLVVSVPAFLYNLWNLLPAVMAGGYLEMYTELNAYSKLGQLVPLLSGWLPIALLMKYAIHCQTRKDLSSIATLAILIYLTVNLFLGARSGPVMVILAFVLTKHYLGRPFTKKQVIPTIIGGYFFIGVLNAVKNVRLLANRNFLTALGTFSISSVVGKFIGELAWSMSSLGWTMKLLEHGSNFHLGQSYLYALTAVIPNLGFWSEHPALKADLGNWMQNSLGRTSGLGYTFIAESYANFGWFGLIAMFIFGCIVGRFMTRVTKVTAKYNYKTTIIIVMVISVLLKSFVRSSFSSIMRQLVFTVILIAVLINLTGNLIRSTRKEGISK